MTEDLSWKQVLLYVKKAKKQQYAPYWPTTGRQILEKLCATFNVDLTDHRQLNVTS